MVTKLLSTLPQQCSYAMLVKNPSTGFDISVPVTLKIRSRSPKSNPLFPFSQQFIYASLVKIHLLVQKIMHGNESGRQRDPHQKQNIPPYSGLGGHNNIVYFFLSLIAQTETDQL